MITEMSRKSPVRCTKCNYPMIRRADLKAIVSACESAKPNQLNSTVSVLRFLSNYIPEAGSALGTLSSHYTLPLSERERWNKMMNAYASGDVKAQECLDLMCRANPSVFERRVCKNCGAPVYIDKSHQGKTLCVFCHEGD